MKNLINYIYSILLLLTVTSCSTDDTGNVSDITYYPSFELVGDQTLYINTAETSTFEDPGVNVTENGVEVDYATSILGAFRGGNSIDLDVADKYSITYSATNQDGFSGSQERIVWVYNNGDLVNSIEGLYYSTVARNGTVTAQYTNMPYVLIWKISDNVYGISDAIGGYYDIGRAYGIGYAAQGMTITANNIPSNNFSFGSNIGVGAFGGSLSMVSMNVNPSTRTINFVSDWDQGYTFDVELTQVNF